MATIKATVLVDERDFTVEYRDHGEANRAIKGSGRPVPITPPKSPSEIGGIAGLGSTAFECPTTSTIKDVNIMYRVIAHHPPSDHPDRDPQHRYCVSISDDYATRAKAQERYAPEAGHTHSIELWYIEPGRNQRLNPFAWPQGH
jgi:hypothetical protein